MNSIELKAHAKINLSIDVISRRPDGYHEVRMIMQAIGLHDKVILQETEEGIDIRCNSSRIPPGSGNIAYKAAKLLQDKCGLAQGVKIILRKNIPVSAGLAGGSTDAAAVLKGMNRMFSLGLKENDLMVLGKEIGADVPFCIKGGTMLAEGIGEKLTPLAPLPQTPLLLVKPKLHVSTKWVYKNLDLNAITRHPDTETLIGAIRDHRPELLAKGMANVLETVTATKYEVIGELKEALMKLGATVSMMSGSGPTVFGIFPDENSAKEASVKLKSGKWNCYLTQTEN